MNSTHILTHTYEADFGKCQWRTAEAYVGKIQHYQGVFILQGIVMEREVADRGGFEPPIRLPVYTLSRRAPSTARPPVHTSRQKSGISNQIGFKNQAFPAAFALTFFIKIGVRASSPRAHRAASSPGENRSEICRISPSFCPRNA